VLKWLKNSEYEFIYDRSAMLNASGEGHVDVLEWFKENGYDFKCDINLAILMGANNLVCDWLEKNEQIVNINNSYDNLNELEDKKSTSIRRPVKVIYY